MDEMRYDFRRLKKEEANQAAAMEKTCFPPHEQVPEQIMLRTVEVRHETTMAAVDRETGRLAGMILGVPTDSEHFRDEFLADAESGDPAGKNIMITGVEVLPEYQRQGLATEMMKRFLAEEKERGRKTAVLTCLDDKVAMYSRMGFTDRGISASDWGGEKWHEMSCELQQTLCRGH